MDALISNISVLWNSIQGFRGFLTREFDALSQENSR